MIIGNVTGPKVTFETQEEVIEVQPETDVRLACQVSRAVRECQWLYRRLNESNFLEDSRQQFSPTDEFHRDCGLTLNKVKPEHEGYWACGARAGVVNGEFVQAKPLRLVISQGIKSESFILPYKSLCCLGPGVYCVDSAQLALSF